MSRNQNPTPQFFDSSGNPLPYGLMYYFESGTNTAKTTYADPNHDVENSHPVQLTGDGRLPNVWFDGSAKQVLGFYDGVGTPPVDLVDVTQIWERDPVTSTEASSFGANWDAVTIYSKNEVVTFNDLLYVSLDNNNQNNNPASDSTAWTEFDLLKRWNVNETYQVRDPVIATDFTIYLSTIANNLGIDPSTDGGVNWIPSGAGSGATFAFTDWDASTDYGNGGANLVTASDSNYYVSIQTPNLNNDPTSSPAFWTQIDYIKEGNITIVGNTIASTVTDSDIDVAPNGTGKLTYNGDVVAILDSPEFVNVPIAPTASVGTDTTQLATTEFVRAEALLGVRIVTITADGDYNPPSDVKALEFTPIGGGGGAGAVDGQSGATAANSSPGSGGGFSTATTTSIEATYTIVIGDGGNGGVSGPNNGVNGGTTTISSVGINMTATGGGGGGQSTGTSGDGFPSVGVPGIGSGGDINGSGTIAGRGRVLSGKSLAVSSSGFCPLIGGGKATVSGVAGSDAGLYGEGGGAVSTAGVQTNFPGGDGFQGAVIIREYF